MNETGIVWLAVVGVLLFAWMLTHLPDVEITTRQQDQDQRAAEIAQSWPPVPAYRVTQDADRVKAKRTLRQVHRVYIQSRRVH